MLFLLIQYNKIFIKIANNQYFEVDIKKDKI